MPKEEPGEAQKARSRNIKKKVKPEIKAKRKGMNCSGIQGMPVVEVYWKGSIELQLGLKKIELMTNKGRQD